MKKKSPQDTKLQKEFQKCIRSKDNYLKSSFKVLNAFFMEEKSEMLMKLLILIEEELASKKSSPEKKVHAMEMLKAASAQDSKQFLQCLSERNILLETVFKIALIDKELVADEKGSNLFPTSKKKKKLEYEMLGSNYIQIAIDCICFWVMNVHDPKTNGALKALYVRLSKSNVRIPRHLKNFGVEFKEPALNEAKPKETSENLVSDKSPHHLAEIMKPSPSNGVQRSQQKKEEAQNLEERKENTDRKSQLDNSTDELNESRIVTSNKLQVSLKDYYQRKGAKTKELAETTANLSDFIWKTKEILLELNLLIMKLNAKFAHLKRYSTLKEQEIALLNDIQQEEQKYLEFERFIDHNSEQALFSDVLERAGKFFEREFVIQEEVRDLPEPTMNRQHTFALVINTTNRLHEKERSNLFKFGTLTPAFQIDQQSPSFKVISRNSVDQASPVIQKFDFSEEAKERLSGRPSNRQSKLNDFQEGKRNSLRPYNPKESHEKMKRLLQTNLAVINELESIKNGIVSSLQQRKRPVPWEAFDGLETIKRELNVHPGKYNSTQVIKTEPCFSPREDKFFVTHSAGLRDEIFMKHQRNLGILSARLQQKNVGNSRIESDSEDYEIDSAKPEGLLNPQKVTAGKTNGLKGQQMNGNHSIPVENPHQGQHSYRGGNGLVKPLVFKIPTFAETEAEYMSSRRTNNKDGAGIGLSKEPSQANESERQVSLFSELEKKLLMQQNSNSIKQFCQVACRKQGTIYESHFMTIDVKYDLVEDSNYSRRLLKVTLFLRNKTKYSISNFKFECFKTPNLTLLQLPEKIKLDIAGGQQLKIDFLIQVNKLPFSDLTVNCQALLKSNPINEEMNFSFILSVTYNMFMTFYSKVSYEKFLENWKHPSRKILSGEPKLLTNEAIQSLGDFRAVLGELLEYPGMIREDGTPGAYALLGVFELEKADTEYLLKINWLPDNKIIAFEIACAEDYSREADFILKTLEFLFTWDQERA